jgi:hypothetical protein
MTAKDTAEDFWITSNAAKVDGNGYLIRCTFSVYTLSFWEHFGSCLFPFFHGVFFSGVRVTETTPETEGNLEQL